MDTIRVTVIALIPFLAFQTQSGFPTRPQVPLFPAPQSVRMEEAQRRFAPFRVQSSVAEFGPVIEALKPRMLSVTEDQAYVSVTIEKVAGLGAEGYRLEIGKNSRLLASTAVGVAWGLQTLRQIQPDQSVTIEDHPSVGFRCVSLDVARRFYPVWSLKKLIDSCSEAKVRYLSLHLSDDQNFMFPSWVFAGSDRHNQSGHPAYLRRDLIELDTYAAARGVALIPEIDIPGHSEQLANLDPTTLRISGSPSSNCLNFASPKVRSKLKRLLNEEAEIFTHAPYIHLGGDEASYPDAEKDPSFLAATKALGSKATPEDVFVDFLSDMASEVVRLGRKPLVWEGFARSQMARERLAKLVTVIAWSGNSYPAKELAGDGFDVINAGWDPYYVVNHYPYDVDTLVPLPKLYGADYRRFGVVDRSAASFTWANNQKLKGAMLCWWEGEHWNALDLLPWRILAFGTRLWNPRGAPSYTEFQNKIQPWLFGEYPFVAPQFGPVPGTGNGIVYSFPATALARPGIQLFIGSLKLPADMSEAGNRFTYLSSDGQPTGGRQSPVLTESQAIATQQWGGMPPQSQIVMERYFQKVGIEPSLTLNCLVTASGEIDPQFPPQFVTDGVSGMLSHYWLAYPSPQTLTIELPTEETVARLEVVACWANAAPTRYRLSLSTDARSFQTVVDASKQTAPATASGYVHRIKPTKARFIRLEALGGDLFPSTMTRICQVRAYSN